MELKVEKLAANYRFKTIKRVAPHALLFFFAATSKSSSSSSITMVRPSAINTSRSVL